MRALALGLALAGLGLGAPAAPASSPAASDPAAQAVIVELPFLEGGANEIWIDLAPEGGRSMRFRLDTGSPHSRVTPGAARAMGVAVRRTKQRPYRRRTCLGRDVEFWVDTRHGERSALGQEWALLGGSFLAEFVLDIDFPARRVRFLDPDRYAVPDHTEEAGAAVVPLQLNGSVPVIEISVGGETLPAVLSTGAAGTLVLSGSWEDRAAVRADPEATAALDLPPGTPALHAAVADRVRIGPFEIRSVPLLVAPEGLAHYGHPGSALLGVDLLKHYALKIDYLRRRLWIQERP